MTASERGDKHVVPDSAVLAGLRLRVLPGPSHTLPFNASIRRRLGCADPSCTLCANNPQRKCGADFFQHKYFQASLRVFS